MQHLNEFLMECMRGREQVKDGQVLVQGIQSGSPCEGGDIAIGDAIRFVDDYRVCLCVRAHAPISFVFFHLLGLDVRVRSRAQIWRQIPDFVAEDAITTENPGCLDAAGSQSKIHGPNGHSSHATSRDPRHKVPPPPSLSPSVRNRRVRKDPVFLVHER
jgi:hypothetical protein